MAAEENCRVVARVLLLEAKLYDVQDDNLHRVLTAAEEEATEVAHACLGMTVAMRLANRLERIMSMDGWME